MKIPLILLTNDDGYNAKGLSSLLNSVKDFGEIVLIAPDVPIGIKTGVSKELLSVMIFPVLAEVFISEDITENFIQI